MAFYYTALESMALVRCQPGDTVSPPPLTWFLYRIRRVLLATFLVGASYSAYLGGQAGYQGARRGYDYLAGLLAPLPPVAQPATASAMTESSAQRASPPGSLPEEIWLVETDEQGELWSNGLHILTTHEKRTKERVYLRFPRDKTPPVPAGKIPVGIVYHTSENDVAPFRAGFNSEILRTSRGLLGWLARRTVYNYFVERFGQVYRLVIDSHTANHAGNSIWADDEHFYLNLNDSFIGVCFESQWDPEAAGEEILTPAQIQAALNLTDMLRARYGISDRNCVPHGLVSVNPRKMLIGYHVDWAKGFPFAASGLSDKYEVALPSIFEYGFNYDEHLLQILNGELWPGIERAQLELEKRAAQEGIDLPLFRKRLHIRYHLELELLVQARSNGLLALSADSGSP